MLSLEEKNKLTAISARLGKVLTDEQMEFAANFVDPTVSFSNPGTGKSYATVVGLIYAQTYKGIRGAKINAMSFTREATAELAARYTKACKELKIMPTVKFATFHSLCLRIIKEEMPGMTPTSEVKLEEDLPAIEAYLEKVGYPAKDRNYSKKVLAAIDKLNSSLAFDNLNVERSSVFKVLDLPIDVFQDLRVEWFIYQKGKRKIPQGDLPLFALYCLCNNPELQKKYKEEFRIMVVDEFQDMSLLNLKVLSLIASNLVAIGDMKQQIYAFNGASQQIVDEYLKVYPNAKQVPLTQSFRCKDNISIYATSVVRRNFPDVERFKGISEGGNIIVESSKKVDLVELVQKFGKEQESRETEGRESMVLFRNNVSAIPLAEELFRQRVNFRMPKFVPIYNMPIFRDLCTLAEAARNPYSVDKVINAFKLFPEFKYVDNNPIVQEMIKTGRGLFQITKNYEFTQDSSEYLMARLVQVRDALIKNDTAAHIFNILLPVYSKFVINNQWWRFPREKEYYFDLVRGIVESKSYEQMFNDELAKVKFIKESEYGSTGVRCYTVHSAKGLEADDVYLLDADEGVFPNDSEIGKLCDLECEYEAARDIRNERNLLYVAVTRAKENVFIFYNSSVTPLLSEPLDNKYNTFDVVYRTSEKNYDDVRAFEQLYKCNSEATSENDEDGLHGLEEI